MFKFRGASQAPSGHLTDLRQAVQWNVLEAPEAKLSWVSGGKPFELTTEHEYGQQDGKRRRLYVSCFYLIPISNLH